MRALNKKKRPKHYTKPKWKSRGKHIIKAMTLTSVHMKNKVRHFSDKFPLPICLILKKWKRKRELIKYIEQSKKEK